MTEFHKPASLRHALELLAADHDARPLSGGQTLVPMMNLGIVQPTAIISLKAIQELQTIDHRPDGSVRIGAGVSHARIAAHVGWIGGQRLLADAAHQIAHPAVRQWGTLGGACAHGDPAADWPSVLCAIDAVIELSSVDGLRHLAAEEFFVDFLSTAIAPGELVTAVVIPAVAGEARYRKFSRVDGDYATVSVAAVVHQENDYCQGLRVALGSVSNRPVRSRELERELIGNSLSPKLFNELARALTHLSSPMSDVRASADYKRGILPGLIIQTLLECTRPC